MPWLLEVSDLSVQGVTLHDCIGRKNSGNLLFSRSVLKSASPVWACSLRSLENASTIAVQFTSISLNCSDNGRTSLPLLRSRSRRMAGSYHSVGRPARSETSTNHIPRSDSILTATQSLL